MGGSKFLRVSRLSLSLSLCRFLRWKPVFSNRGQALNQEGPNIFEHFTRMASGLYSVGLGVRQSGGREQHII